VSEATHPASFRVYYVTWGWLLVMTLLALGVGYVSMPRAIHSALLVAITLAKVILIAAIFMHLRFEKLNLIMITFTPLVLAMILFFFISPDTADTATRVLTVR
jgi:cytochrome c oxidase subunit IV